MTLEEAIKHAEEVAEEKENEGKLLCQSEGASIGCLTCAEEHRQLAEWLKDYKRLLEPKTIEEIQAESEKYQKAFEDGYDHGYAQAKFDYKQEPILEEIKAEINTEIQAHLSPKDDVFFCLDYVCRLIDEKVKEYNK